MRALSRRERGLLGLVAVALLAAGGWALTHSGAAPAVLGRPRAERPLPRVPRVDLARIDRPRPDVQAGRRDLFQFGAPVGEARDDVEDVEPVALPATPPPPPGGESATAVAAAPSLPPLNLKYIGSVESKAGVKVAVLLTDRQEILTGKAGEVVANRLKIVSVGLESVDVQDVGASGVRRGDGREDRRPRHWDYCSARELPRSSWCS